MFKFKSLMVAGLLLGSMAGLPGAMQSADAQDVHFIRQDLKGKQVVIYLIDGQKVSGEVVYQDADSIGIRAGQTYYIPYAQVRQIVFN